MARARPRQQGHPWLAEALERIGVGVGLEEATAQKMRPGIGDRRRRLGELGRGVSTAHGPAATTKARPPTSTAPTATRVPAGSG